MAEAAVPTQSAPENSDPIQYWCYQCDKRVSIETLADLPDVICYECKNGFVEAISAAVPPPPPHISRSSDPIDEPTFSNQFIQVLRLIAQASREDDAPPPPPSDPADPSDDDYLRIELNGWDNDDDDEDDDDDNNNNDDVEVGDEEGEENRDRDRDVENENEEEMRRHRRDVLRLRLRDLATRAASRRNRILDWAEILMGLEDHSIELRFQVPESDNYIGNPEDYVDAAGYEALLQNLAESSDGSGRRGAPPASKSAVLGLKTVEIKSKEECLVCAICKDNLNVGEVSKEMPCGHGYHEDCIVPWLGSRNSCPVCRFELETDDPEYEYERKKRMTGPSSSRV